MEDTNSGQMQLPIIWSWTSLQFVGRFLKVAALKVATGKGLELRLVWYLRKVQDKSTRLDLKQLLKELFLVDSLVPRTEIFGIESNVKCLEIR